MTLKHLHIGIQRYMRNVCGKADISIFDSKKFAAFRQTLDAKMKDLNRKEIHLHRKQAEPLTADHERVLWDTGVFNLISGRGVQNTVYFYTGKVFGLRACDKHSHLRCEQFSLVEDTVVISSTWAKSARTTRVGCPLPEG